MARYGYIMIDRTDSDLGRQAVQLDAIGGFSRIFVDKHDGSGPRWSQREKLFTTLKPGDIVYAAAADRFCANLADFLACFDLIAQKGADLFLLEEQLDSRSNCGQQSIRLLQVFSNLDFFDQSEKKKAGIRQARQAGRRIGRPPVALPPGFRDICRRWEKGEISTAQAMAQSGLKSTSFYKNAAEFGFKAPGKRSEKS